MSWKRADVILSEDGVGPETESRCIAPAVALRHFLMQMPHDGGHPLHVAGAIRPWLPRLSPCSTVPAST